MRKTLLVIQAVLALALGREVSTFFIAPSQHGVAVDLSRASWDEGLHDWFDAFQLWRLHGAVKDLKVSRQLVGMASNLVQRLHVATVFILDVSFVLVDNSRS